ncbi:MAG: DEAD/DEAH box helicase [Syntrophobacteraceae bacterium]
MSFDQLQLSAPILKALARCGHNTPTPVQAKAIPEALARHDLIASANTGTGKTAAFVLPALQLLSSEPSKKGLRVLVLTPTRELATQIAAATRDYGRYLNVHSVAIYGGMPFGDQIRALSQSPGMIIATPGRLIDHIWRGRIDLSSVELFILDEADRMLDMGFIDDVEFVSDAVPENCQKLLFAATMGQAPALLARKFMKNPVRIEIAQGKITHDKIEQRLHIADNLQHKNNLLRHLCADQSVTRAIIFSATKRDADSLARSLCAQGHTVEALHGDMTQSARNRTMANMRRGKIRLLVATDVAARGIDITGVSHVINFDLPRSAEDYVNRIGRTGRADESGIAISLASRADLPYLDRIERYIGQNLKLHVIPGLEPSSGASRPGRSRAAQPSGQSSGRPKRIAGRNPSNGHATVPANGYGAARRPRRPRNTGTPQ